VPTLLRRRPKPVRRRRVLPFSRTAADTTVLPRIIDDNATGLTTGFSTTDTWITDSNGLCLGSSGLYHNTNGTGTASYAFTGLTAGVSYDVAASWSTTAIGATAFPWEILDSDGTTVLDSGTVNQSALPSGFRDINLYDLLGTVTPSGTSLTLKWTVPTETSKRAYVDSARVSVASVVDPTTYDANTSDFSFIGKSTAGTFLGRADAREHRQYGYAVGRFRGTHLVVSGRGGALGVSVDGGAFSTVTPGSATQWSRTTLFSGLSDDWHTVVVRNTTGTFYYDKWSFSLFGSAADAELPDGYVVTADVHYPALDTSYIMGDGATVDTAGVQDRLTTPVALAYDYSARFEASTDELAFMVWGAGNKYRLSVDQAQVGTLATAESVTAYAIIRFTGLDTSRHEYRLWQSSGTASGIAAVWAPGGTVHTDAMTPLDTVLFVGDSVTAGASILTSAGDSGLNWPQQVCNVLRLGCLNRGVAGTGWLTETSSNAHEDLIATYVAHAPDRIISLTGLNDGNAGGFSASAYGDAMEATITGVRASLPTVRWDVFEYLESGATNANTNRSAANAEQLAVVQGIGSANVRNHTTTGVVAHPGDYTDTLHINATGADKVADYMILDLSRKALSTFRRTMRFFRRVG
jgi:lysophospholipase L1-like esterase